MFLTLGVSRLLFIFFLIFNVGIKTTYANYECSTYLDITTAPLETSIHTSNGILPLNGHRQLFYQTFNLNDLNQPVLVFFPGIYSALAEDSDFFKYLESKNVPYVNFHFSSHPRSIATLDPNGELPTFNNLSTDDLAHEVVQLVEHLGLKKAVPVTLSYSSTLISSLPKDLFPTVIDTAPMGRMTESYELQFYFTNIWNSFATLNPASFWFNTELRRQSHYNYWHAHVKLLMEDNQTLQNPRLADLATKAYVTMTKIVEKYDIRNLDFQSGPERIFILATDESHRRLQLQKDAVKIAEQQLGYKPEVYNVEGANHIVAYSQPQAYADLLIKILNNL